jgi:hypothetical protein
MGQVSLDFHPLTQLNPVAEIYYNLWGLGTE